MSFCAQKTDIDILGLAEIRTLDAALIKTILKMPLAGVNHLPLQLTRNIFEHKALKKREILCARYQIPLLAWESMNSDHALEWVKENKIDLILNLRTRDIYKAPILEAPTLGCVNIHHGLLPYYRGTFCDLYALSEGRPAGFSIHKMEKRIDDGEIYDVVEVARHIKNYQQYLALTIQKEIRALNLFIEKVALHNELPMALYFDLEKEKISYTRNPNLKKIKSLKKQGFIL